MNIYKKEIMAALERFRYCRSRREVFLDAVEYDALFIATTFDLYNRDKRLLRMQEISKLYSGQDAELFAKIRESIFKGLSELINNFEDFLGDLYMEIEAGNKQAGQYFTPYEVSKFMAGVAFAIPPDPERAFTLNEPACGSGGMVIAAADTLNELHFNYADKLLVVANDIDRNCVNMTYLQISFAAVPAVVKWQDTLTQVTHDIFITPAFALQRSKFLRMYEKLENKGE